MKKFPTSGIRATITIRLLGFKSCLICIISGFFFVIIITMFCFIIQFVYIIIFSCAFLQYRSGITELGVEPFIEDEGAGDLHVQVNCL